VPTDLPRGFLLHENEATADPLRGQNDRDGWSRGDSRAARWYVQPCQTSADYASDSARTAARTLQHLTHDASSVEQLVVYRDARAAVAAMAEMRQRLRRCAYDTRGPQTPLRYTVQPVAIGGEAFRALGTTVAATTQAEKMIVVRKGAAIVLYGAFGEVGPVTAGGTADLEKDARRMDGQLCRYTVAGC